MKFLVNNTETRNSYGYKDATAHRAIKAVQKNESDYKAQLIDQKDEEAQQFIRNLRLFIKKSGYELVSEIVIRNKKTGKIH